ncbi:MAG TPA: hypothetical protein VMV56_03475 [Williamwhitmania sp.]|nr:hypothetical protein [Williamwhitmania sp.]
MNKVVKQVAIPSCQYLNCPQVTIKKRELFLKKVNEYHQKLILKPAPSNIFTGSYTLNNLTQSVTFEQKEDAHLSQRKDQPWTQGN